MEQSHWLSPVGLGEIHLGNDQHDGYGVIHLGAPLNLEGVNALEKYLKAKMKKDVDSVFGSRQTVKVAAKKRNKRQLDYEELSKLIRSACRCINTWASETTPHEIIFFTDLKDASNAGITHSVIDTWDNVH